MSMGLVPHHLICDHTHLWEFSNMQKEFLEQLYFWPFELIHLGVFLLPFEFEFEFHLIFFDECKVTLNLAHYLTQGSDNSPPLNRISSQDSEVCGRKVGYSARRRSSLSHVASPSEWCDHCTFRNLIFCRRVTHSSESRIRTGYSR